jgi:uncharacterized protein
MPTIEEARNWYPDDDPVHGFEHVMRVYHMAERLAITEGADLEIVRAAALLHDAQEEGNHGQQSVDQRIVHHLTSAEMAGEVLWAEGWETPRIEAVQHCIRAHRFRDGREPPRTLEARVLFDADKLDAIGAIGAARAIAYAAQVGQPTYAQPSQRFLETGQTEPGEPHSAYHEFVFKLRKLKDRLYTPSARQIGEERHRYLEEFFTQLTGEITGQR